MKKPLALVFVFFLCLSVCACGTTGNNEETDEITTNTSAELSVSSDDSVGSTEEINMTVTNEAPGAATAAPSGDSDTTVFTAKPSETDLASGSFISVGDVDQKYITQSNANMVFLSATAPQFSIGGITHPEENGNQYFRLDITKKSTYTATVASLAENTAGVTVRFRTDAASFQLKAKMTNVNTTRKHVTDRASYGFDVYTGSGTDRVYCGGNMQFMTEPVSINETILLPGGFVEVTVNLPVMAGISSLSFGFPSTAKIAEPLERSCGDIAFYGSSITQGGCVSRPGNTYTTIVCRMLDADCVNLGFSGAALGEQEIAEYIAGLDISAFVMDYDHNNTVAGLKISHYKFYETVRAAHPDIPIILMSRPVYTAECTQEILDRQKIIKTTYEKAVAAGDKNIYYISGYDFFPHTMPDLYTVDMVHPNDLGHYHMAMSIYEVLAAALEAAEK